MKIKTSEQFVKFVAGLQPPAKSDADKALQHLIAQAQRLDADRALAKLGRSL